MFNIPSSSTQNDVISVSELNRTTRQLLEKAFPLIWVAGEISNLTRAASGHWYFSLKDDQAQVRCVMFRHKNQYLDWVPENGMQVEIRSLVTLYEARGDFQLGVEAMRRSGLGALFEAFEKLKMRLDQEGLFDPAHKKALPAFPRQIGVITSRDAAALRDVLTTLRRRMPSIPIVLYPTPVQGEGAAAKITDAIRAASARNECDVLILCRGGGSIEDLWQFNQEMVARAIHECSIPIVCGVGHETDFTIADFVADQRAPTPTAAAEMVSPNRPDLLHKVEAGSARLSRVMSRVLEIRMQHLDHLGRRLLHPGEKLNNQSMHLSHLEQRLRNAAVRMVDNYRWRTEQLSHRLQRTKPDIDALLGQQRDLAQRLRISHHRRLENLDATLHKLQANLHHLNPKSVLERGYSMVETADGKIAQSSETITAGDQLKITFAQGWAQTQVLKTDRTN